MDQKGAALLLVLLASALVAALAVGVLVTADTDRRLSATFARAIDGREAADAVLARTVSDLSAIPNWTTALSGGATSAFLDASHPVVTSSRVVLDLDAITTSLQAETDAMASSNVNRPRWRLWASGPVANLLGLPPAENLSYGAAWVGDDWRESDNDPAADTNGVVLVRADAWGVGGSRRAVEATIAHGVALESCNLVAFSGYDLGIPALRQVDVYRAVLLAPTTRSRARPIPASTGSAEDPCRLLGPGATMVTWREVR
jgi:hypothetical protein